MSSKAGSRASASSSEFRKAKAEKAALLARAAALKGKQALQLEEIKLKAKLEQMELGAEIAASTAKIKVLQNEGEDLDGVSQGDAMNDYYDEHGQGMEATATEEEFMQWHCQEIWFAAACIWKQIEAILKLEGF
ncbi:hypothetical protein DPEC_G00040680 [Dallia pectoralis]|uniref:Uncharacterized protein n=2 Tax=Dallia pectoralis TaxID=75939 RepID=A0ACC2HFE5_DALPE|nr:hypothetical protein DPEC_G00273530 [Dallia pectoralis]KAJ8014481.1 hypothetical protein DPEC_G00040680 [Dallia pectoralis]